MKGLTRALARPLRAAAVERGGATAVEFGLILPMFLMLLLGSMETGRALWTQNALNFAVEQAARCAAIDQNHCGTATQVQTYAAAAAGAGFARSIFSVSTVACGNLVSASYPIQLHIPFVTSALTLTAQSCYP